MEVLAAIAGKIAELTVIPIGRQVDYLIFYKENLKKLNEHLKELETRKARIERDIEAERRKGREIEDDVVGWQKQVEDTLEKRKKLYEDEPHDSVRCWKWSCPNLKSRHQIGRKAKKMALTIIELKEKKFDGRIGYVLTPNSANLIFATRGSEKLESRNSLKKEVMLSLTDPKVRKVGIYGLPGLGKTTLAKDVANHVKDDKMFDVVAVATISQTLDVKRVQDEIADQLGFRFDETTPIGRANQLCARIKMEKNILIILDDLWEKIDLDKLGILPEKNETYQGCKLLLTSRCLDILDMNETQKNFCLNTVNYAESWSLFEDMIGDAIKDDNLKRIAAQVVKKCAGLPLMIVSIANSLKGNKNIHYWKDVLNNLERVDNGDMHGNVFSAFGFTYEGLKDDEMKKVFLLCGVFGPSILVSDLLKYVIGLGILKHKDTVEDARDRLYRIIQDLKASCLLLEDDATETDVIKMHDLVREVAVSIAEKKEHVFVLKRNGEKQDWLSKGSFQRFTRIILKPCFLQELPSKLDCPNLKFFHLHCPNNYTLKIPDSFFEGMRSLKALDLTGLIISSLPRSLVSLSKLKTLCLDQCRLEHLTGIGALKNLEILSFIYSSMKELPSEIEQLAHLRMLDLSNSGIGIMPPNILSKLTKIEELYMGNTSIKWEEESSSMQNMESKSLIELGCLKSLTTLEIHIREAWISSMDMMFDKLERYKVVIGDKWEWSSNKKISRLLKLKLGTSIHLEPGIKALIKRVEDLYLDEVNGISDVLLDLEGTGFPQLKHLHIQNNGQVQHIINTTERNETHALFPQLETLVLYNLNNLEKICRGPVPVNSFCKLTIIKVENCDQLVYLLSVLMVKALSQLVEIQVSKCNSMKMILYIENADSCITSDEKIEFNSLRSLSIDHLPAIHDFCSNQFTSCMTTTSLFNDNKVSFSGLETLKLCSVNLEKIWDDDDLCAANCFHNLANLTVEDCRSLKHLFSSSVVGSLLELKHLEISKCEMMEEIIAPKGINITTLEEVRLPKLETMVIKDMKSLKKVWHFQFEGLKSLEVSNCGKLVNIFPSDMQGTFGNIETLKVKDCDLVEAIFQLTAKEIHSEDETMTQVSQLKKLHLLGLPKLKRIWSRDAHRADLQFHNLHLVCVEECENLEYLFPFSIAKKAAQLEDITIKYASNMKQIVLDKEGPLDSSVEFEFNHLTSLVLWGLHELEGLFARKHSVLCPLLSILDIRQCWKLKLFKIQSTSGREIVFDSKLQIPIKQHLFPLEKVICNLETLGLSSEDANMILQGQFSGKHFSKLKRLVLSDFMGDHTTFPYWFLQTITTLTVLLVEWSSFREIFPEEIPTDEKRRSDIRTRIKKLSLHQLYKLQHICKEGFQVDPVLEILEYLLVNHCSNLKHLVPSSVTFCHLTYLEVENCKGLIHLITSSTARSLVKLTKMKIKNCNSLEQVVAEEREGSEDEIALNSLEVLELECLPMIKRFCSSNCALNLQWLEKVVVQQCPRMSIFSMKHTSTPMLQEILSKEEDGKIYWEGDLNRTINKMFVDMVAFHSIKNLKLDEYPELWELWYSHVQPEVYGNLNSLVVHKCDFLSDVLLPLHLVQALSNLEELEVRECDSLEAVFDLTNMDQKEVFVKESIKLKRITLFRLPKLKHMWKQKLQELINFRETAERVHLPNLQSVRVENCENLEYLFPFSIAMHATQLKDITIRNAGSMKRIVSDKEVSFSSLKTLELRSINMEQIWDYDHLSAANCMHNLVDLTVEDCRGLKHLFSYSAIGSLSRLEHLEISRCEMMEEIIAPKGKNNIALEEVRFSKLETMVIKDMKRLKNVWHFQFESLKNLEVSNCGKLANIFPFELQGTFGSLETLKVNDCGLVEEIFELSTTKEIHSEEETTTQVSQLKKLHLLGLPKLKQIWSRDAQANLHFYNLQFVCVERCENLEYLFPFSITIHAIQLEDITIRNAGSMKHIVSDKEGILDGPIIFEFHHLASLVLWKLYELEGFFARNHSVRCPLLRELDVRQCVRLNLFKTQNTSGRERLFDSKLQTSTQRSLFTLEKVICNLERLALNNEDASMILQGQFSREHFSELKFLCLANFEDDHSTFPYWFLQNITTLNELHVECSSFKEIFQGEIPMDDEEKFKIETRIEKLTLNQLYDLQHICKEGFQIDPVLEDLEYLLVQHCYKLKHLVPSTVTCSRLTYLEVQNCNGLIHLIASSTAKSLVNLETMIIRNCNSLEQVVVEDKESKDVIAFKYLKVLEFECLPALKMFCSASYCLLELRWLEEVVISNCPRMEIFSLGKTEAPMLEKVLTQKEDGKEHWQGDLNGTVNKIFQDMADQVVDTTKQEITNLPSSSDDRQQKEDVSTTYPQDAEIHGTIQTDQVMDSLATTQDTEESHGSSTGIQEMCDTLKKPSTLVAQNVSSSSSNMILDAATMYPSPSQSPELATAQSKEGSHESETCPRENLFNQPKILATCDNNEAVGSQEICESDQHAQKLATTENTVIGTHQERHETIDKVPLIQPSQKHIESYHDLEKVNETIEKPLIQTSQHTQRPTTGQDIEESHESKTCANEDSFNQPETFVTRDKEENIHDTMDKTLIQTDQDAEKLATIQNTEESRDSYTGTPKICNTIKQASISAAQDVSNSTMILEAAIDPSPSQAPKPAISPTEKLNIYRNYKEMIDISKQNMPYLEAGVNRHPQVLDWLDTKRRRVFASSTFSLFAEVTCILRTTRKGHLTEDDRSYIIECCTVLEAAGFDVSWLSYVHKCIEECGDAEDMKRKVEETKGQASSLEAQIESMKKELASVKESLVLLLDKARTLDDFIES